MSRLSDAIARFARAEIYHRRQVRRGRYVRPYGLRRGLVRVGGCGQIITGDRLSDLEPGASVLVADDGPRVIISAPPTRSGPRVAVTRKLAGTDFGPEVPVIKAIAFLLLVRSGAFPGGELLYLAYTAEGEEVGDVGDAYSGEGVGVAIFPDPELGLGPGTRVAYEPTSGDLVTIDYLGPTPPTSSGAVYAYTPPSPWLATAPMQIVAEGDVYWWEWQAQTSSATTPVRLMRSDPLWASPSVVFSGTAGGAGFGPRWDAAFGADFTGSRAGLWLEINDGEVARWHRIAVPLAGGTLEQAASPGTEDFGSAWPIGDAGLPAGSTSITRTSADYGTALPGTGGNEAPLPPATWDGDETGSYGAWGSVGDAAALAPDPGGVGIWAVGEDGLAHYSDGGSLMGSAITGIGLPVGLAVLADTFDIELPPEGEGE